METTFTAAEVAASRAILHRAERKVRAMALRFMFPHCAWTGAKLRKSARALRSTFRPAETFNTHAYHCAKCAHGYGPLCQTGENLFALAMGGVR